MQNAITMLADVDELGRNQIDTFKLQAAQSDDTSCVDVQANLHSCSLFLHKYRPLHLATYVHRTLAAALIYAQYGVWGQVVRHHSARR